MRMTLLMVLGVVSLTPTLASAQAAPATPPAPAASGGAAPAPTTSSRPYTTATTDIGTLLDDPASKAVVDRYVPGFSTNDQVEMARGMTLRDVQQYAPDQLTDKVLENIDAAFAKLPPKS